MRQLTGDGAPAQRLLLPLTLDFSAAELEAIEAHRELLRRVGFEVEPFSGRSVVVHTAPNPHPRFDAARCLQELVADLAGGRFGGLANRLERFAATFACRAAIKAGQRLGVEEMRELVLRLLSATLPAHDVHGRPTVVQRPRGWPRSVAPAANRWWWGERGSTCGRWRRACSTSRRSMPGGANGCVSGRRGCR